MKELRTIILAAGKGLRMKSDTPKVLHKVCGQPLIDYPLQIAKSVGSSKITVVIGHQSEKLEDYLRDKGVATVEQKQLLGTGDAVKSAASFFGHYRGDALILCGDTPLLETETVKNLIQKHRTTKAACTFLTALVSEPTGYGRILRSPQGAAVAIREENDANESEKGICEINVGVYCFKSEILFKFIGAIPMNAVKREFYLTDMVAILASNDLRVETVQTDEAGQGLGVNSRCDLAKCEALLQERTLKKFMLEGVTIVDPRSTFIHPQTLIGQDTIIKPFTVIEDNVQIGAHCTIGPFARLRPGTRLADHVEIGNFAEVSRSQVDRDSLMKHFSFLGDARVGKGVNIGAGVVTANYDGKNKNVTTIGDKAFVGSDSILVAPVKIGKKAVTGAGSVVTRGRNVPDGTVVAGVPARPLGKKTE